MRNIPAVRVRRANTAPLRPDGEFVLYWMIAARRTRYNFGLQHAALMARDLGRPLIVLEALRAGYRWASDRIHAFVIQGMSDNASAFRDTPVAYYPYVEAQPGEGTGLLESLAGRACAVVTDEFPCFFLPRMVTAAARRLPVRLDAVDGNGLLPLHENDREFTRAFSFRIHLHKRLPDHLDDFPTAEPLRGLRLPRATIPAEVSRRWPAAEPEKLPGKLHVLPIDHGVPVAAERGGQEVGRKRLREFLGRLEDYVELRNHPDEAGQSGLSPWLHFGHLSAHEIVAAIFEAQGWTPERLGDRRGKREGWWGLSPSAEAFLDELITWRELGYHHCRARPDDYDRYESLPAFALETLAEHASDARPYVYTLEEFEQARTHDAIWNAAQRQLRQEGRIHNYPRMLWGKKVLHWTRDPRQALEFLIELNNRWALDGRNPNSYSGIFWCLGRFDRAWGPERPVFGKVRYMSSERTPKKVRMARYLERFGA